jgi:hypothetical protein
MALKMKMLMDVHHVWDRYVTVRLNGTLARRSGRKSETIVIMAMKVVEYAPWWMERGIVV